MNHFLYGLDIGRRRKVNNDPLLAIFEKNQDKFVSGEQLSIALSCSRTAIWKKIQKLTKDGYLFEAVPRLGYKLIGVPDRFDMVKFATKLRTVRLGKSQTYVDETTSTQDLMRTLITNGAKEGRLVIAESQTLGRGRLGRSWHSPAGKGLWFSVLLQPTVPLRAISQLTLLTAVALCKSLRAETGLKIGIKWPNDLLIDGKKISGILLESMAEDDRIQFVIAGIGISVNLTQDDFPVALHPIATSLRIATKNHVFSREDILASFINEYEALYDTYLLNGFSPIQKLWEQMSVTLNQHVRVQQLNQTLEGYAVGIDEQGALLLRQSNGDLIRCYSGDTDR